MTEVSSSLLTKTCAAFETPRLIYESRRLPTAYSSSAFETAPYLVRQVPEAVQTAAATVVLTLGSDVSSRLGRPNCVTCLFLRP